MRITAAHIVFCFMMLFMLSCSQDKKTDWHVTFDKNSKEPYGCYIVYHLLDEIFPSTKIVSGRNIFTEINRSLDGNNLSYDNNRLSIMVCRNFEVDSAEFDKIIRYIKQGNTVCIFAENFSDTIFNYFHLQYDLAYSSYTASYPNGEGDINNQKTTIFFNHVQHPFSYTGLPVNYAFAIDSNYHDTYYYMGYANNIDSPNSMIHSEGKGEFIICRNPIALTNHFLLQHDNYKFIEYFFSYFYKYPNSVTWYNTYERIKNDNTENDWSWLLHFPPLFYAFLLLALLFLFYTLFEGRRRQRDIPVLPVNTNSSLEFTETVGRLYYNKKDNKNLSDKMILHYLETIRSKYGFKTNELNEEFVTLLSQKINQSFADTNAFIGYILYIRDAANVNDNDIKHLYHQLKKFM